MPPFSLTDEAKKSLTSVVRKSRQKRIGLPEVTPIDFRTTETEQEAPQGIIKSTIKKTPQAFGALTKFFERNIKEERKKQEDFSLGQKAVRDLVERPAEILKTISVDFPRDILAGLSSAGKSIIESVGVRVMGADREAIRDKLKPKTDLELRIADVITRGPTESFQQFKAQLQPVIDEHPEATDFEKKYLAGMAAGIAFGVELTPFGRARGAVTEVAKIISKTDDIVKVEQQVRRIVTGSDAEIKKVTNALVSKTDTTEVSTILRGAGTRQKTKLTQAQAQQIAKDLQIKVGDVGVKPKAPTKIQKEIRGVITPPVEKITSKETALLRSRIKLVEQNARQVSATISRNARTLRKAIEGGEKKLRIVQQKALKDNIIQRSKQRAITESLTKKVKTTELIRKDIFKFARENLPDSQFRFVAKLITTAKTHGNLSTALKKIIIQRNKNIKNEAVNKLKTIAGDLDSLPIEYTSKLNTLLNTIKFKTPRKDVKAKIEALRDFLEKNPDAKFDFESQKNLSKLFEIKELGKTDATDIPLKDLLALVRKVDHAHKEALLAKKALFGTTVDGQRIPGLLQLEQDNSATFIANTAKNLDTENVVEKKLGKALTKEEKWGNASWNYQDQLKRGELGYVSVDNAFDLVDGMLDNPLKGAAMREIRLPVRDAVDKARGAAQVMEDNFGDAVTALFKKHGKDPFVKDIKNFTDAQAEAMGERIWGYAVQRQIGVAGKFKEAGIVSAKELASTKTLSPLELDIYNLMRDDFEKLYPQVVKRMREGYQQDVGFVENFFPIQSDFGETDVVMDRMFNHFRRETARGFTKIRTSKASKGVEKNAFAIYKKYMNDTNYFIHADKEIQRATGIANNEIYQEAVGKNFTNWTKSYLDIVARRGFPAGYKFNWMDVALARVGRAILGFNPSTVIKQPLAKVTSATLLGPKHATIHTKEFVIGKSMKPNTQVNNLVMDASLQQKLRVVDDPAFAELVNTGRLDKLGREAYLGIKVVDKFTANDTWYAAYKKYFDDNDIKYSLDDFYDKKFNKEGVEYADFITRKTQGTGAFQDIPQFMVGQNRKAWRAILQFRSFVMNQSQLFTHDAIRRELVEKGKPGKALKITAALFASALAEDQISVWLTSAYGSEAWEKHLKERTIMEKTGDVALSLLPPVDAAVKFFSDERTGIPSVDLARGTVSSGVNIVTGKANTPEKKVKEGTRFLGGLASFYGVPGMGFAGTLSRGQAVGADRWFATPVEQMVEAAKTDNIQKMKILMAEFEEKGLDTKAIRKKTMATIKREKTKEDKATAAKILDKIDGKSPEKAKELLVEFEEAGLLTKEVRKQIVSLQKSKKRKEALGE